MTEVLLVSGPGASLVLLILACSRLSVRGNNPQSGQVTNKGLKQAILTPPKPISFFNNVQDPFSTEISYRDIWNLAEISYELPTFLSAVRFNADGQEEGGGELGNF